MGTAYVALLRGINVGGNNLIRMPDLADALTMAGLGDVRTYIQSGNVVFTGTDVTETGVEAAIAGRFGMSIPVLLLERAEMAAVVEAAPASFGDPDFRADVLFLKKPLTAAAALDSLPPLAEGIDQVWPGPGVLYFSRLDAKRTKSRLSRVVGTPVYQQMSIRNWNTTRKLHDLVTQLP